MKYAGGIAVILPLMLICAGCQTIIHPPENVREPVAVYLTDYGRHSSLLLPTDDGGLVEYAFGDWRWFALEDTRPIVALQAMFRSPQATLGRRYIYAQDATVPELRKILRASTLLKLQAERNRAVALRRGLDQRFEDKAEETVFSKNSYLEHIKDEQRYDVCRNCNHVTAEWLRRLGFGVSGPAMFSRFRLPPPESRELWPGS